MTPNQFHKFIQYLQKENKVFGPVKKEGKIYLEEISRPQEIVLDGRIPVYPFKNYLLPPQEEIFSYEKEKLISPRSEFPSQVLLGLTVFDLKALVLYQQVFEKDPYFQDKIKKTIIIGQGLRPKEGTDARFLAELYEEHVLEHLSFDIFLQKGKGGYKVLTGSEDGMRLLDKFGYKGYDNVQFSGPIREEGLDKAMVKIRDKMKKKFKARIWKELGERCLECGKCSLVCPTCFCFRIDDLASLKNKEGKRMRAWDTCFYNEFSEVAGGLKFLSTTAQRIYFWYEHKFVRIPDEYSLPGCVGCGRCVDVCPVGIDIRKVVKEILKG